MFASEATMVIRNYDVPQTSCRQYQLAPKPKAGGLSCHQHELRILTTRGQKAQQQQSRLDST